MWSSALPLPSSRQSNSGWCPRRGLLPAAERWPAPRSDNAPVRITAALGLKHSVGSPAATPSSAMTNGNVTYYVTSAMGLILCLHDFSETVQAELTGDVRFS